MRSLWLAALMGAALTAAAADDRAPADEPSAKEIVDRVDRMLRGDSSVGKVRMSVVTARWQRNMTLAIWSVGMEKTLVKVLAPPKQAGTATLKVGSDIWNYLPKIDRTIRVPSSMMMASWMGSHFTNDDLVKESRMVRDYDITTSFSGLRDGEDIYEFTLRPLPEAPVVWGRIVYEVRRVDLMPIRARYFGEDERLRRTLTFSDYRRMGDRVVPARMRMVPADKPGESTEIEYLQLSFDTVFDQDRVFSLSSLRSRP